MMNNKKGISAIVATVMIIMITVAAVAIIWTAIIPMLGDQLNSATLCLDAVKETQLDQSGGYTCVNTTGETVSLRVTRGSKAFDLADIQVLISAKGSTETFTILTEDANAILPDAPGARVYVIDTSSMTSADIEEVQIAPIINVGNSEKTCEVSGTVKLRDC